MVDDLIDTFLSIMIWVVFLAGFAIWILLLYDTANNGVNDCSDDPKYCVTPQELERNWPQFKELLDAR